MKSFNMMPEKILSFPSPFKKEVQRGQFYKMYKKGIWKKLRLAKLEKNPLCELCLPEGKLERGICIDHIKPHRGDWDRFLDFKNLQTLCKSCHNRKRQRERGKYVNRQ